MLFGLIIRVNVVRVNVLRVNVVRHNVGVFRGGLARRSQVLVVKLRHLQGGEPQGKG